MKVIIPSFAIFLFIVFIHPLPASAYFFPNISSIPASLIPNGSAWDAFMDLLGCQKGQKLVGIGKFKSYFQKFGYLNSSYSDFSDDFDDYLEYAVKTYQLNFNLNETGVLDAQTLKQIVVPRCGNPDVINGTSVMQFGSRLRNSSNIHTVAHYSFFPNRPRWPASKSQLTYAFAPENQLPNTVRTVIGVAFERWSEVTTLTFTETSSFRAADIRIGFFSGDHGDGEPFDGLMGTLAHAFSPTNGRCHFDGDENWVVDGNFINGSPLSAVDLESVAVHEVGHLLGLGHSSVPDAIMYPTLSSGSRRVELANDDIMGIQELYGSNPNFNGTGPVLNPNPSPRSERDTNSAAPVYPRSFLINFLLVLILFITFM